MSSAAVLLLLALTRPESRQMFDKVNAMKNATAYPRTVAYKRWGERRMFDPVQAQKEGIWKPSGGGLRSFDRAILSRIYYESDSVFETGIGESTTIAMYTRVPRYTGVDNSVEWLTQVREKAPHHYRFHWADIGETRDWSWPKTAEMARAVTPKMPFASTAALTAEGEGFDFYFVDGRFRVASFAMAFLHASIHGRAPSEFRVGIHDFRMRAKTHYKDCYRIGQAIEGYGVNKTDVEVTIFRRKHGVTDGEIMDVWRKHQFDLR